MKVLFSKRQYNEYGTDRASTAWADNLDQRH